TRLIIEHVDAFLLERSTLLTKRRKLIPLVEQRQRLVDRPRPPPGPARARTPSEDHRLGPGPHPDRDAGGPGPPRRTAEGSSPRSQANPTGESSSDSQHRA